MRIRTHLIAMPWSPPDSPSIQIACLKAYLDQALPGRDSDCRTYSAFFSILHQFRGRSFLDFFHQTAFCGEYVYQALYLRRFGPAELRGRRAMLRLLQTLREPATRSLSLRMLNGLERATCRYLDTRLVPRLIARGLNLVGFTLNYDQVYASLYAAEYLRRKYPERQFLFVYGGCSASLPNVYALLQKLGIAGVVVVGEGEKKLELLVRACGELPAAEVGSVLGAVRGLDPGIIVIGEPVDLTERNPAHYASRIASLKELPLPDYGEYFAALQRACADEETFAAFRAATEIFVEGSRGCFGHCDFCGLNRTWLGFRAHTADRIFHDVLALTRKYGTSRIVFADSVCDRWAEDYARMAMQAGITQSSPLEVRADHPERFWTLLALAGVEGVQVGVEALSSRLLEAMGKGTRAVHNLAAHKYLSELGVHSNNQLIGHHPASTLADIRETRQILKQIPHWDPFDPVKFELMPGSPLYERLSGKERAALRQVRPFRLPARAARYAIEKSFEVPKRLRPRHDVVRAWDAFAREYQRERAEHVKSRRRLDVARLSPDALRITDTRNAKTLSYVFSGAAAQVYDACHRGLKLDQIVKVTGLSPRIVKAQLARFLRLKLVLRVDDDYLSLAMRPRDELLCKLFVSESGRLEIHGSGRNFDTPDRDMS